MFCCLIQNLDVGREIKAKRANTKKEQIGTFPGGQRSNTYLLEARHVQQGVNFRGVKEFGKALEDVLGLGKQGAEAGDHVHQGAEQAASFRRDQSLTGRKKNKHTPHEITDTVSLPWRAPFSHENLLV